MDKVAERSTPGQAGASQPFPRWTIILITFTTLTLFYTGVSYLLVAVLARERFFIENILIWNATQFYLWAALAPAVMLLARRHPLDRTRWPGTVLFHGGASLIFSLVQVSLSLSLYRLLGGPQSQAMLPSFAMAIQRSGQPFALGVIVYWVIVIASYGIDYYSRYRSEQSRTLQLEKELATAQLQALKMQLQPHFLFNTLHSLSDLVLEDTTAAVQMITRLGDFLRLTLDGPSEQLISLGQELRFVRAYLAIERVRFQDRLQLIEEIEPEIDSAQVPNLILQPLVENAIRHGISARIGAGRLRIAAQRDGPQLRFEIEDDGPGTALSPRREGDGLGLENIRGRLAHLYGRNYCLALTQGPWGGTLASLTLPLELPGTDE